MATRTVVLCAMLLAVAPFAPAAEPIVQYSFEELGPVVVDESGNGNDATPFGGVSLNANGRFGKCFEFNGTDSYIQLDRPIQDAFTITAWINTSETGASGTQGYQGTGIFWSDVGGVANDFIVAVLGPKLSFFVGNPDISVNSDGDVVTGEWMHIAAVRDTTAQTISVYIDGEPDNTVSHSNTAALNAQDAMAIGANTLDARYFAGLIDEVKIYDVVLTAAEIKAMVPPKLKARKPNPADGTIGVTMPLLQWAKGDTAVLHNMYLGTSPDLTEADLKAARHPMTMYYLISGLESGVTYFWRVDEIEADGATIHTGDTWTFMTQAETAYYPNPQDGANAVSLTPTLTWMLGTGAFQHHVYFGDNADAVSQGSAETDKGAFGMTETTFAPDALESLTTYYWRVDEVGVGDAVKTGPIWSFTTALPVDGFEDYTDEEGGRIYETWIDGWTNGTGSTVGYVQAPFAEQTIVHEGLQSMPLEYNNVDSPFYSEAELEFSGTRDWTADGIDALIIYVQGRAMNGAAPVYVAIEDASGQVVVLAHPDAALVNATTWIEWRISLGDLADVDLSRVKKLYLGAGDRANPTAGGSGLLYIDSIRLAKP